MHLNIISLAALALPLAHATKSSKRGLIYIANSKHQSDDQIWTQPGSDLTWYYNYGLQPSSALSSSKLQFVPMLWGAPSSTSDTTFLDGVKSQISSGKNISYILSFNEPDGTTKTGGSNIAPSLAASTWIREVEPLKKLGVKVGAPAVTGSQQGMRWLQNFFTSCNGGCTPDFIPVHWYGPFQGLASHLGEVTGTYKNISEVWVTEYALSHSSLADSEDFYNQSAALLDRWENITHYSYFGSFRSDVSNVGPNAAMLTQDGKLTDIGSWYLGGNATGAVPKGAAEKSSMFAGWLGTYVCDRLMVIIVMFCLGL